MKVSPSSTAFSRSVFYGCITAGTMAAAVFTRIARDLLAAGPRHRGPHGLDECTRRPMELYELDGNPATALSGQLFCNFEPFLHVLRIPLLLAPFQLCHPPTRASRCPPANRHRRNGSGISQRQRSRPALEWPRVRSQPRTSAATTALHASEEILFGSERKDLRNSADRINTIARMARELIARHAQRR